MSFLCQNRTGTGRSFIMIKRTSGVGWGRAVDDARGVVRVDRTSRAARRLAHIRQASLRHLRRGPLGIWAGTMHPARPQAHGYGSILRLVSGVTVTR
jgi:hypothetical protein